MAKSNPELETYLQSQANSLEFILQLISALDRLPRTAYKTPNLFKVTILPKQKITAKRAWQLVTTYLDNHNLPYYLKPKTSKFTPENVFALFHYLQLTHQRLYQQDPELLHQLVEQQRQASQNLTPTPELAAYDKALVAWKKRIQDYNHHLEQTSKYLHPQQFLPVGGDQFFDSTQSQQLAQQLAKFLPQAIHRARQFNPHGQLTSTHLHLALQQELPPSPTTRTFLTLLHDQDNLQSFFDQIQTLLPQTKTLVKIQEDLALTPPPHLPLTEIERQAYHLILTKTNLDSATAAQISQEITSATQLSGFRSRPKSIDQVLHQVLRRHHLDSSQLESVLSPLLPHLQLLQQEKHTHFQLAKSHRATPKMSSWIIKTIIRETGLDPTILNQDRSQEIRQLLKLDTNASEDQLLLKLQQRLGEATDPQELQHLLDLTDFLQQRLQLNQGLESKLTKWSTKLLLKTYQNNLSLTASFNRYALAYQKGLDFYLKTEDILTGRFIFAKFYDVLEEWKKTNWGWLIAPFEKAGLWWDQVVKNGVARGILFLSNKTSFAAKLAKKSLELFRLGGYTSTGFIVEAYKATLVWSYRQGLKLVKTVSKPAGKAISWVSGKLIVVTSSTAFKTVSETLGTSLAFALQGIMLAWNLLSDLYQFGSDLFRAFGSPSLMGMLSGLWDAFRRLGTKNIMGVVGALIGAALLSFSGPGAIAAAAAGFLLGHQLGSLLNTFYDRFLKPFTLFFAAAALAFITSLGAIVLANLSLLFLIPVIAYFIFSFLYSAVINSARIPEGAGQIQSQYIYVIKHATATWKDASMPGQIDNSQLPQTVTYSITVRARSDNLTNVTIEDEATLYQKDNRETTIYHKTVKLDKLELGNSYTYTYEIPLTKNYQDSFLSNSVEVSAIVNGKEEVSPDGIGIIIGNPPLLPLADFAQKLAQAITSNCSTTIDGKLAVTDASISTSKCQKAIFQLPTKNRQQVYQDLKVSATSFTFLQCIGFTRAAVRGALGLNLTGQKYAGLYVNHPPNGFHKVSTPQSGDLFIMPGNPGHIGVVVKVAGSVVTVADANAAGAGYTRPNGSIPVSKIAIFYRPNH